MTKQKLNKIFCYIGLLSSSILLIDTLITDTEYKVANIASYASMLLFMLYLLYLNKKNERTKMREKNNTDKED